jgi:hypothetical protein
MLPGVNQSMFDAVELPKFFNDRSDLHEVGTRPDHAQDSTHPDNPSRMLALVSSKGEKIWLSKCFMLKQYYGVSGRSCK